MNSVKNNVALIVHSCDRYEFLFKGFAYFFEKHWDFSIACNYYFATEEKSVEVAGFKNILSGKDEWADRLAYLLTEKINEKYVLYFQEDMWLNKDINANFFNQLFLMAEEKNWLQVKLHSSGIYKTHSTNTFIEGFNIAELDNVNSEFLMSHQVTLWNREFLIKQLHRNEHPWRNERKGTKRLRKLNPKIIHIDYFSENGSAEINNNDCPFLRSEYQSISVNGILNDNIIHFIEELKIDAAEENRLYALKLEYNYQNMLTHDGKPKPRKIGVFKKIKNFVRGK